jgi:hypothetical protein
MPDSTRATRRSSRPRYVSCCSAALLLLALPGSACHETPALPRVLVNEIFPSDSPTRFDQIELVNAEPTAVALSGWWLCSYPNYFPFPAGTELAPGALLVVTLGTGTDTAGEIFAPALGGLRPGDGEVALYAAGGDFDDAASLADYVQWGLAGNDREPVAVEAGLWLAGTTVDTAGLADGSESVARTSADGSVTGADAWAIDTMSIGAAN